MKIGVEFLVLLLVTGIRLTKKGTDTSFPISLLQSLTVLSNFQTLRSFTVPVVVNQRDKNWIFNRSKRIKVGLIEKE